MLPKAVFATAFASILFGTFAFAQQPDPTPAPVPPAPFLQSHGARAGTG